MFLMLFLVLSNLYVTPVPEMCGTLGAAKGCRAAFCQVTSLPPVLVRTCQVSMTTKGFDLESLRCMAVNCGRQILDCVTDNTCKAGLDCLQACSFNDQVCERIRGKGAEEGDWENGHRVFDTSLTVSRTASASRDCLQACRYSDQPSLLPLPHCGPHSSRYSTHPRSFHPLSRLL